jgi:AAA domain
MALAWAFALAFGRNFLRWRSRRKARVLFVDGEMPRDLLQDRLQLMCRLIKIDPDETDDYLSVLSKEDYDDMQPLDTEEGQAWLDEFIKTHGPFDFIVFDNIMTLCSGIMKEEESWQALKPYVLGLTKRRIGQLWIHHTGHDATHSYGTKTREWQMDTVIKAESLSTDHISFNLIFKKHTRSKPSNYEDFEDMHVELLDNKWVHSGAVEKVGGRPTKRREIVLQALRDVIGRGTDASEEEWRNRAIELGISKSGDRESQRRAFNRARDDVIGDAVRPKAGGRYALASLTRQN